MLWEIISKRSSRTREHELCSAVGDSIEEVESDKGTCIVQCCRRYYQRSRVGQGNMHCAVLWEIVSKKSSWTREHALCSAVGDSIKEVKSDKGTCIVQCCGR